MSDTTTLRSPEPQQASQPNRHGDFIWYELLTGDPLAAKRFYDSVVGWTVEEQASNPMDYRMIDTGDGQVGGVMRIDDKMKAGGARPCWLGYIAVDDVDTAAEQAQAAGASVHMPPTDIPDVGRFAMLADPQGAPFYIMRGNSDEPSTAFVPGMKHGHAVWNELVTSGQEGALNFYTGQFGWSRGDAMPMGELGDYRFINQGDTMIGAVMKQPAPGVPPMWVTYFYVPDIDRAAEAVRAGGGTVHQGPVEIPGGDFSLTAGDPEGAIFGLVGPRT